jgi:hypothetical protein
MHPWPKASTAGTGGALLRSSRPWGRWWSPVAAPLELEREGEERVETGEEGGGKNIANRWTSL